MKPKGIIPGITALCAILGMLIGVQYNTVQSQAASEAGTDNVRLTELLRNCARNGKKEKHWKNSWTSRQNCWRLMKQENLTVRLWNLCRKKMRNCGRLPDCQNRQVPVSL